MALLVTSSRDDNSLRPEREAVPPLFAGLVRDDLLGAQFETALKEVRDELSEDRFVDGLGKFREALVLSRGHEALEQKIREAATSEVAKLMPGNWRVAEAMLFEVEQAAGQSAAFNTVWAEIERQKREDTIQVALEESGRAEHSEYLPHLRSRLLRLAEIYPGDAGLEARLHVLEGLLSQRVADDREKNLRRLALFRDRLDESENPETLRSFRTLIAPFADAYNGEADFAAILDEVRSLRSTYENAAALLSEQRSRESLEVCNHVLERRPGNILFRRLEEKAKGREWVMLLAESAVERAREFEQNGQYAEALEEWESLRGIDPHYPGLDSEVLHCAALKQRLAAGNSVERLFLEEAEAEPPVDENDLPNEWPPSLVSLAKSSSLPLGVKIAITEEAWNHLKTGLAATVALLLVVLVLAANSRH